LKKKIADWLERIELPDVQKKKCEELSKGMQQKVQFLASIIHDPELIILDEPFTGLDPVNAKVIGKVIDELHSEGRTILFSTHVLPQAEQICNRIVMIDQGIKVLDGTIASIREQFDPRMIQVEPVDELADFSQVTGVSQTLPINKDGKINLRLEENADPSRILKEIVSFTPVLGAQLVKPTLDEIFIEQVVQRRGMEAAAATREELSHA
jgi:ABC-2 type transport system ATP-binding protein